MPIVLSYEDVGALGALAAQAGAAQGNMQRSQHEAAFAFDREQLARQQGLAREQMRAETQQADLDRQLRSDIAGAELGQRATLAGLEGYQQRAREESSFARDLMGHDLDVQRDDLNHARDMERLAEEARLGKYQRTESPKAIQERQQQEFGHLAPQPEVLSAKALSRNKSVMAQIAAMSPESIDAMLANDPGSKWAPYAQAIAQARRSAQSTPVTKMTDEELMAEWDRAQ